VIATLRKTKAFHLSLLARLAWVACAPKLKDFCQSRITSLPALEHSLKTCDNRGKAGLAKRKGVKGWENRKARSRMRALPGGRRKRVMADGGS